MATYAVAWIKTAALHATCTVEANTEFADDCRVVLSLRDETSGDLEDWHRFLACHLDAEAAETLARDLLAAVAIIREAVCA